MKSEALARMEEQEQRWQMLMVEALSGNEESYQQLLGELVVVLRGYVKRKLRKESDVEDVVQEILLSIHRARHTYDVNRAFGPWMYAIAKRRTIDRLRVGNRFSRELQCDSWDTEWWLERSGGEEVAENMRDLQREFEKLSEHKRKALELVTVEGRSTREAAELMEMKESAFRVMFHRTVHSLKSVLVGKSED